MCKAHHPVIPREEMPSSQTVVSLLNGSRNHGAQFQPELLQRMDSLFAFYHQQWWCYRKMLNHFKFYNALFNGLALLLMAAGMIAGPILENSTLVTCLAAVGTVVKGWNNFKQYPFRVAMSRFAFTTYAKAKRCVQDYHRRFVYQPVEAQCYVDGCHRPLMSQGYWTEKDKKQLPPSPTLLSTEPWPSDDDDDAEEKDDDNKAAVGGKI